MHRDRFLIEVRFHGRFSFRQRQAFYMAATRWADAIISRHPGPFDPRDSTAHLVIDTRAADLGGVGGILGRAGPSIVVRQTGLPIRGIMEFDIADLDMLERENGLVNTIVHEMGHVLGLGSLWNAHGLTRGINTNNPVYVGRYAVEEFTRLTSGFELQPVPLENTGGPGTREGHWRETLFGNELMTGYLNPGTNPLSRLSVASLRDLGFEVRMEAADHYTLDQTTVPRSPGKSWLCNHQSPDCHSIDSSEAVGALRGETYDHCCRTGEVLP